MSNLLKIAGLFEKKTRDGDTYLVGRVGAAKVVVVKDECAGSDQPQWNLFVHEPKKLLANKSLEPS